MASDAQPCTPSIGRINPLAAAVALASGSLALAPATVLGDDNGLFENITVSATRRSTDVQDVPYNISAYSGEALEGLRIEDLSQFARWVPGLTLVDQGQRAANLLTVRGLNASSIVASEALGNNGGGTVATYVGDIPVYVDLRPLDIERVEVLMGPQGTLYGSGTLAGAVRYIPKRPSTEAASLDLHARGYTLAESDSPGYGADAAFNIPINDRLAFRGVVGYMKEAGFVDYNFIVGRDQAGKISPEDFAQLRRKKDADDLEIMSARASLLWKVTNDVDALFTYHFQDKKSGGRTINHVESFGTGKYEAAHRFLEPNERQNQILSLEVSANFELGPLGPVQLVSATGYSMYMDDGQRDQTDLLLNFGYGYEDFPEFSAFTHDFSDEDTFTQELRVVSTGDSRWNWIAGAFYSKFNVDGTSQEFTPGIPEFFGLAPPPLPTGDLEYQSVQDSSEKQVAVFGELGYQLTDNWQITGGMRWFDYEIKENIVVDIPLVGIVGTTPDPKKISENDVIFKFNTSYRLDNAVPGMDSGNLYFTFSQGYRTGGFNGVGECPDPLPPGQNVCALPDELTFGTDKTNNYEVGLKSDWLDQRLTANVSLFYIQWNDVQIDTITVNGAQPIIGNASDAVSKGLELALKYQLTDRLSVFGTYSYTNAKLVKDAPGAVGVRGGHNAGNPTVGPAESVDAFDGDRLPGTPVHQGGLNLNYFWPMSSGLDLELDYGLTAISNVYTKIGMRGSGEALGGFAVHKASASLSKGPWTATLYADNLTNKFARTGVRADRDYIDTVGVPNFRLRRYYHNIIRPRTIGLDFRYKFDL